VSTNPTEPSSGGQQDRLILGLELVITTAVFAGFGWLLDRWFGTFPVLTVALGAFTCAYLVWKLVSGYDAQMAHEIGRRSPLRRGPADG
jgi:F0F1-type ATP synthase assembly protein I